MLNTAKLCVASALAAVALAPKTEVVAPASERIHVLVVSGANNHDFQWTTPMLSEILAATGRFDVEVTEDPAKTFADAAALKRFGVLLLNYNGLRWGEPAETNFLAAVKGGVGVTVIHAANNAFTDWPEYLKLVGDYWKQDVTGHGSFHPFDVKITDANHPITAGLGDLKNHSDELYHKLARTPGTNYRVLATALSTKESGGTGNDEPMIMVGEYGQGRVFHTPLGHVWSNSPDQHVSQLDPQFQRLVARGTEWAATGAVAPDTAWQVLFDGSSTAAWRAYKKPDFPAKGWKVQDGALVVEKGGGGGDIVSKEQYGDLSLAFDFRLTSKANSGVMYRVAEDQDETYFTGPEFQVLADDYFDGAVDTMHSAGSLYAITPATGGKLVPTGEWNRGLVVLRGWQVEHWLNGVLVSKCDLSSEDGKKRIAASKFAAMPAFAKHDRGFIALQDHGDEVAYRNVRVRDLGSKSQARAIELFNGKDLTGWTYCLNDNGKPADVWSVEGGVLICKGQPVGYIRTEADYTNYVLDLDWRFNPVTKKAGNSGVLLRMTGPDQVWPKSLEAQLESGNAGDFWVIEKFPCKTAPERTNDRNCKKTKANEKPIGEWNHYHITVDHGTVTLDVNGEVLNQATDAQVIPGKICLQSEGAEIHFRNIRLTPLP
jgi:type 1 glutamine amidotransferase